MKPLPKDPRLAAVLCGILMPIAGCSQMNHTQSGAALGSGLGALAGAIIGHQSDHAAAGALIGAATGGLTGGLIGNAQDAREERDAAIAQAAYVEAAQQALTNYDLIRMAQSGLSDDVIITAVNTRGGQFDLSPDAIIHLKSNGVSDRVILAVQHAGSAAPVHAGRPATVVTAPATSVIVVPKTPPVSLGVVVGPRPIVVAPHRHRFFGPPRFHRRRW